MKSKLFLVPQARKSVEHPYNYYYYWHFETEAESCLREDSENVMLFRLHHLTYFDHFTNEIRDAHVCRCWFNINQLPCIVFLKFRAGKQELSVEESISVVLCPLVLPVLRALLLRRRRAQFLGNARPRSKFIVSTGSYATRRAPPARGSCTAPCFIAALAASVRFIVFWALSNWGNDDLLFLTLSQRSCLSCSNWTESRVHI